MAIICDVYKTLMIYLDHIPNFKVLSISHLFSPRAVLWHTTPGCDVTGREQNTFIGGLYCIYDRIYFYI